MSDTSSEKATTNSFSSAPTIIVTPVDGIPSDFCSGGSFSSPDEFVPQQGDAPLSPITTPRQKSSSSSECFDPSPGKAKQSSFPGTVHETEFDSPDQPNLSTLNVVDSDGSIDLLDDVGFLGESAAARSSDMDL
jgi:hypothetical protein